MADAPARELGWACDLALAALVVDAAQLSASPEEVAVAWGPIEPEAQADVKLGVTQRLEQGQLLLDLAEDQGQLEQHALDGSMDQLQQQQQQQQEEQQQEQEEQRQQQQEEQVPEVTQEELEELEEKRALQEALLAEGSAHIVEEQGGAAQQLDSEEQQLLREMLMLGDEQQGSQHGEGDGRSISHQQQQEQQHGEGGISLRDHGEVELQGRADSPWEDGEAVANAVLSAGANAGISAGANAGMCEVPQGFGRDLSRSSSVSMPPSEAPAAQPPFPRAEGTSAALGGGQAQARPQQEGKRAGATDAEGARAAQASARAGGKAASGPAAIARRSKAAPVAAVVAGAATQQQRQQQRQQAPAAAHKRSSYPGQAPAPAVVSSGRAGRNSHTGNAKPQAADTAAAAAAVAAMGNNGGGGSGRGGGGSEGGVSARGRPAAARTGEPGEKAAERVVSAGPPLRPPRRDPPATKRSRSLPRNVQRAKRLPPVKAPLKEILHPHGNTPTSTKQQRKPSSYAALHTEHARHSQSVLHWDRRGGVFERHSVAGEGEGKRGPSDSGQAAPGEREGERENAARLGEQGPERKHHLASDGGGGAAAAAAPADAVGLAGAAQTPALWPPANNSTGALPVGEALQAQDSASALPHAPPGLGRQILAALLADCESAPPPSSVVERLQQARLGTPPAGAGGRSEEARLLAELAELEAAQKALELGPYAAAALEEAGQVAGAAAGADAGQRVMARLEAATQLQQRLREAATVVAATADQVLQQGEVFRGAEWGGAAAAAPRAEGAPGQGSGVPAPAPAASTASLAAAAASAQIDGKPWLVERLGPDRLGPDRLGPDRAPKDGSGEGANMGTGGGSGSRDEAALAAAAAAAAWRQDAGVAVAAAPAPAASGAEGGAAHGGARLGGGLGAEDSDQLAVLLYMPSPDVGQRGATKQQQQQQQQQAKVQQQQQQIQQERLAVAEVKHQAAAPAAMRKQEPVSTSVGPPESQGTAPATVGQVAAPAHRDAAVRTGAAAGAAAAGGLRNAHDNGADADRDAADGLASGAAAASQGGLGLAQGAASGAAGAAAMPPQLAAARMERSRHIAQQLARLQEESRRLQEQSTQLQRRAAEMQRQAGILGTPEAARVAHAAGASASEGGAVPAGIAAVGKMQGGRSGPGAEVPSAASATPSGQDPAADPGVSPADGAASSHVANHESSQRQQAGGQVKATPEQPAAPTSPAPAPAPVIAWGAPKRGAMSPGSPALQPMQPQPSSALTPPALHRPHGFTPVRLSPAKAHLVRGGSGGYGSGGGYSSSGGYGGSGGGYGNSGGGGKPVVVTTTFSGTQLPDLHTPGRLGLRLDDVLPRPPKPQFPGSAASSMEMQLPSWSDLVSSPITSPLKAFRTHPSQQALAPSPPAAAAAAATALSSEPSSSSTGAAAAGVGSGLSPRPSQLPEPLAPQASRHKFLPAIQFHPKMPPTPDPAPLVLTPAQAAGGAAGAASQLALQPQLSGAAQYLAARPAPFRAQPLEAQPLSYGDGMSGGGGQGAVDRGVDGTEAVPQEGQAGTKARGAKAGAPAASARTKGKQGPSRARQHAEEQAAAAQQQQQLELQRQQQQQQQQLQQLQQQQQQVVGGLVPWASQLPPQPPQPMGPMGPVGPWMVPSPWLAGLPQQGPAGGNAAAAAAAQGQAQVQVGGVQRQAPQQEEVVKGKKAVTSGRRRQPRQPKEATGQAVQSAEEQQQSAAAAAAAAAAAQGLSAIPQPLFMAGLPYAQYGLGALGQPLAGMPNMAGLAGLSYPLGPGMAYGPLGLGPGQGGAAFEAPGEAPGGASARKQGDKARASGARKGGAAQAEAVHGASQQQQQQLLQQLQQQQLQQQQLQQLALHGMQGALGPALPWGIPLPAAAAGGGAMPGPMAAGHMGGPGFGGVDERGYAGNLGNAWMQRAGAIERQQSEHYRDMEDAVLGRLDKQQHHARGAGQRGAAGAGPDDAAAAGGRPPFRLF